MAGCGAAAPSRSVVQEPVVVAPAAEPTGAPIAEPREDRRRNRRDGAAGGAAAGTDEPVPVDVQQAYDRALTAMRGENWLDAEIELEQLVFQHPGYPGPYVNLAIVYMHDERTKDAQEMLDGALAIDAGHAAANNQLGILLRNAGKFSEAEVAYRRALDTQPSYALAHYNLGVLLDLYLHRQAEALEQYELYQRSLAEPDEAVGRWIIDLRRRLGVAENASRVAKEDGE